MDSSEGLFLILMHTGVAEKKNFLRGTFTDVVYCTLYKTLFTGVLLDLSLSTERCSPKRRVLWYCRMRSKIMFWMCHPNYGALIYVLFSEVL